MTLGAPFSSDLHYIEDLTSLRSLSPGPLRKRLPRSLENTVGGGAIVFPELGRVLRSAEFVDPKLNGAVPISGWLGGLTYERRGIWFPTFALCVAQSGDDSYRQTYQTVLRAWLLEHRCLYRRMGVVPMVIFDYRVDGIDLFQGQPPSLLVPTPATASDFHQVSLVMQAIGRVGGVMMMHEGFVSASGAKSERRPKALETVERLLRTGNEESARILVAEVQVTDLKEWLAGLSSGEREAMIRSDRLRLIPRGGFQELIGNSAEPLLLYGSDYPHPGFSEHAAIAKRWRSHLWPDFAALT